MESIRCACGRHRYQVLRPLRNAERPLKLPEQHWRRYSNAHEVPAIRLAFFLQIKRHMRGMHTRFKQGSLDCECIWARKLTLLFLFASREGKALLFQSSFLILEAIERFASPVRTDSREEAAYSSTEKVELRLATAFLEHTQHSQHTHTHTHRHKHTPAHTHTHGFSQHPTYSTNTTPRMQHNMRTTQHCTTYTAQFPATRQQQSVFGTSSCDVGKFCGNVLV